MANHEPRARVGTSGWKKPMWRGYFYPPRLAQRLELDHAASQLATLEINTTFHGLPRPSSYQKWYAETPEDFVFSVKGNQTVTHEQRLRNPAENVALFFSSGVLELKEKLGPILWQLPPSLLFDVATLEPFLSTLPHSVRDARRLIAAYDGDISQLALDAPDRPIQHALEVRHRSFQNPAFRNLLRKYDVAATVTNSPGWPSILDVTSGSVYVRLHGDVNHYPNGYDDAELDRWAALINGWTSGENCPDGRGRDVFVYFDNPDHSGIRSPLDAILLQQRLNGPGPTRSHRTDPPAQPQLW